MNSDMTLMENKVDKSTASEKTSAFSSIRVKMLLSFIPLFIVMIAAIELVKLYGLPFAGIEGMYVVEQKRAFKNLSMVADMKKEHLARWFEERKDDAAVIVNSSLIKQHLVKLNAIIQEHAAQDRDGMQLWNEVKKSRVFLDFHNHLNLIKESYAVYDFIDIADEKSRKVIVSSDTRRVGSILSSDMKRNEDYHVGIEFDASDREFDLVIHQPVRIENRIIARFTMTVRTDDFIEPLIHTGGGLGDTGEAMLVDQDLRILTSLRHTLADGSSPEPLQFKVKSRSAEFASSGEEGITMNDDYRGVQVLAAYRHLRITSETGWGMVIKRDVSEIFAPFKEELIRSMAITFLGVLFKQPKL